MDKHQGVFKNASGQVSLRNDTILLKPEYLIKHVEEASEISRYNLEERNLDFAIYCEYILPYRIAHEPITNWSYELRNKYSWVLDSVKEGYITENSYKICALINKDLASGFQFSYKVKNAHYLSWNELIRDKKGDCYTMTHLATYPLRALGVPVTIDFVPVWGNINGGSHAWNVLLTGDGKTIPFMGCETNPPNYYPFALYHPERSKRLPPKVFRTIFSSNPESLPNLAPKQEPIPLYLMQEHIKDVTGEYFPVSTITIPINEHCKKKLQNNKIAYLSVFNNGDWIPVFWSRKEGSQFLFKKMANKMLYLPCIYNANTQITPIASPLVINETGEIKNLIPNNDSSINITVTYTQSKALDELNVYNMGLESEDFYKMMDDVNQNKIRSKPVQGKIYNLYHWNNGWKKIAEEHCTSGQLVFKNVPSNGLYRLYSGEGKVWKDRPFTYENGQQIWW